MIAKPVKIPIDNQKLSKNNQHEQLKKERNLQAIRIDAIYKRSPLGVDKNRIF